MAYELKAGDVVVIPAGTGHWFTKIDDHLNYLMIRIDPDKVTPIKDEAKSKEWLDTKKIGKIPKRAKSRHAGRARRAKKTSRLHFDHPWFHG